MPGHISDMADDLAAEVLSEAAETFFGQRKALESEIEIFHKKVEALRKVGERALLSQSIMHRVLVDQKVIQDFYSTLGVPAPELLRTATIPEVAAHVPRSFAWTLRGRFFKLLFKSYAAMHMVVEEYRHGGYKNDPADSRRKIAMFGYLKIRKWARQINEKVNTVNTQQAPSEVLRFVKGLDVQETEKEKCIGASCEVGRDKGMLFPCVDFEVLALPDFPELPSPTDACSRLQDLCKELLPGKAPQIRSLLRELATARRKGIQGHGSEDACAESKECVNMTKNGEKS